MLQRTGLLVLAVSAFARCAAGREGDWQQMEAKIDAKYHKLLVQLTSQEDVHGRAMAWARLKPERDVTIAALEQIADADERSPLMAGVPPDVVPLLRRQAIEALGEFRAVGARAFLVAHLTLKLPGAYGEEIGPFDDYPAAQAILDVGEPAIQELFPRLGQAGGEEELKLIAYVFWYYYAPQDEQDVGLYRLKHRLKQMETRRAESAKLTGRADPPPQREKNLTRLIEIYQQIKPNDRKDWPRP